MLEFESSLGRPGLELICEFESPHCWLLLPPLLLLCRLMGRLPIGCMGRMTAVSACTFASLNQRPTCHLP